jgi:hypothetical protein
MTSVDEEMPTAGTALTINPALTEYAGTSLPTGALADQFQLMFSCEVERTVYEHVPNVLGARRPKKYQTRFVPKVTGKDVRRFGQNRGRY